MGASVTINKVLAFWGQERFTTMTKFHIFVIRAILGLVFAVIATRMFYGRVAVPYVVGLAIILLGLAYFAEYLRHRKNR